MKITITSISCKPVSLEEKMAIGNIGTGNTFTMAKLNTGRDTLQVAFSCTGGRHRSVCFAERMDERPTGTDGVEVEVSHVAKWQNGIGKRRRVSMVHHNVNDMAPTVYADKISDDGCRSVCCMIVGFVYMGVPI